MARWRNNITATDNKTTTAPAMNSVRRVRDGKCVFSATAEMSLVIQELRRNVKFGLRQIL